jgi:hypothetical protein
MPSVTQSPEPLLAHQSVFVPHLNRKAQGLEKIAHQGFWA